jgi:hypothetical protein
LLTYRNASVIARWTLLPVVAVVALFIELLAFSMNADASSKAIYCMALIVAAALIVLMCVGIAPSHKRVVAVVTFVVVAAFVVKFVPYPNVGLPFGYWVYPNRAIKAFLECPNVGGISI